MCLLQICMTCLPGNREKYVHDRLASLITYSGESNYNQTLYSPLCQQETRACRLCQSISVSDDKPGGCHVSPLRRNCTGQFYRGCCLVDTCLEYCLSGWRYVNVDLTWDDTKPLPAQDSSAMHNITVQILMHLFSRRISE